MQIRPLQSASTMGAKPSQSSKVLEDTVPKARDACISELAVQPVYVLASRLNRTRFETAFPYGSLPLQAQKQQWPALQISISQRQRLNLISKGQLYVALVRRLAMLPRRRKSAGHLALFPSKSDGNIALKLAFCIASKHRFCGLFSKSSPECSATLVAHTDWITSVAFHPSGCHLLTCSRDKTIRLWRLNQHGSAAECTSTIKVKTAAVADFHPSAPYFAIVSGDGTSLWRLDKDCVKAKLVLSLSATSTCSRERGLFYVAFHPSAPYLATPSADGALLWRLGKDCTSAQDISLLQGQGFCGLPDVVHCVAFHPSASFVASGTQDGTVKLWRLNQSYCDAVCVQKLQRHEGPLHSVVFHASAPLVATAGSDGTANVWSFDADRSELTHVTTLRGHSYSVYCIAFHPSAPFLVTGSGDGQAKLWFVNPQRADAACVSTMRGLGGPVRSVAFHPSAACIAAGSDFGGVKLWR